MPPPYLIFSANYEYIETALLARWRTFYTLAQEMNEFVPKPLSDFAYLRVPEIIRQHQLNPGDSTESLITRVEEQIAAHASRDFQFYDRFNKRHMIEFVSVVLLSHALSEALINIILAIGLAHADLIDQFSIMERADFKKKWLTAPKRFADTYSFPKGTELYETLDRLAQQRNALAHYKIDLHVNGDKVLRGSEFEREKFEFETRWIFRFFNLPYDLADFARRSLPALPLGLLTDRDPIETRLVHRK